ncbi:membrane-bound transglycosylase, SLT family [Sulfurimonas gotlandica GD1]|jgi:membrane-bound lytic murein transglycosylase F|uniref:Membrane-bound transglycosylase, SLT family n=1 Tax=Sulfurimonas gotlandica (strain DSM 19862 / JCM 16533 / GD1) TaxID=929558 RepID=B6BJ86_SULGG|nr:membrane-bound lytic murein transglycosylase MltF [Sulfurimonas gotlandica]EDZ62958.1 lytic transglycosylase, catalytic [Sulfurimonas gotlandica GD1]EHP30603.1 membrane-bound transglycosylase, SLT family [Sulfurimonas gotlandica GD1]
MTNYKPKLVVAVLFFIVGWQASLFYVNTSKPETTTLLEKIKAKKRLDVVILNAPTVYYVGSYKEHGFEYELISSYAKEIGVDLNLTVVYTASEALQKTRDGIGDITVASLSDTSSRIKEFKFGPQYYTIEEQLICNSGMHKTGTIPKSIEDLAGLNIVVGKDTSYEATMRKLAQEVGGIDFSISDEYSTEQLLELTHNQKIDCTVADSNIFLINQRYYPDLVRTLALSEKKKLAWMLREGDNSVKDSLYKWLNIYEHSGKMAELRDFYYSFLGIFDYYDTTVFYKRLKTRLPKYEKYFKEAEEKYNIPWILLAAQSYQESHWNPNAKSHTGVRGMMMLTQSTAKQMDVKNRLNAKESIDAGARYLSMMEQRFPKEIKGKSRWAFTLAAYNVGMGHVHDAQTLARKLNKNPYSWNDIKKVLPLLSQKKYYKHLKYGYARGDEPVRYVNSIQHYLDIIHKDQLEKN